MYNRIVGVKGEKKNEKNMEAKTVIGTAFDLYGTGNDRGVCECTDARLRKITQLFHQGQ